MAKDLHIENLGEVLKNLNKADKVIHEKIRVEFVRAANEIRNNALGNLRGQVQKWSGMLGTSIQVKYPGKLSVEIGAYKHYAPYVEFGTGAKVLIPEGLEDYAMQFKGKGLKEVNLPARPFLFPAFFRQIPILKQALTKIV